MRVLIAGGGTGGHFYPGLAIAEDLQQQGVEISWLGATRGIEARRLPGLGIPYRLVNVSGFVGVSPTAKLASLASLVPALVVSRRYLGRVKPDVVLSVGGYAALPGGMAAAMAGVPLVLQEQNAVPGVVHKLLAPWSSAIACGFPHAVQAFPSLPATWTGNPVRRAFFQVSPPPKHPVILVMGGSQGSQMLNELVPQALAQLPSHEPQIIHQTGERWEAQVRARYKDLGLDARVTGYLAEPWNELSQASLVIARAGALTVSELAAARRAAILVPFGQAAGGHQQVNAQALASAGAAWVLTESEATPSALATLLTLSLSDLDFLARKGAQGAALVRVDATQRIVGLLFRAAGKGGRIAA